MLEIPQEIIAERVEKLSKKATLPEEEKNLLQ